MDAHLCTKKDKDIWVALNKKYMLEEIGGTDFWHETVDRAKKMLEKSFDEALEKEDAIKLVLFEVNGETIGFANLTRFYSVWSSGDAILLDDFFILEEYRDLGLGEEAMLIIEKFAIENEFKRIQFHMDITNPTAESFYKEAGYKPIDMKFYMKNL